jgi:hypothetical protein
VNIDNNLIMPSFRDLTAHVLLEISAIEGHICLVKIEFRPNI